MEEWNAASPQVTTTTEPVFPLLSETFVKRAMLHCATFLDTVVK